jgi:pyridoxine/pyridoxamine 5'-phosphate oxidase
MSLDRNALVAFIRQHGIGVVSTVDASGAPEAALVYLAVNDDLELVFYALQDTRKSTNLRRDPRVAVVIGWSEKKTLQFEGVADEPAGIDLDNAKRIYAAARPDAGLQMQWPGLTYFRVRPKWVRMSNYGRPWSVEEMKF